MQGNGAAAAQAVYSVDAQVQHTLQYISRVLQQQPRGQQQHHELGGHGSSGSTISTDHNAPQSTVLDPNDTNTLQAVAALLRIAKEHNHNPQHERMHVQQQESRKAAAQLLRELEITAGFPSCLLSLATAGTEAASVALQAVLRGAEPVMAANSSSNSNNPSQAVLVDNMRLLAIIVFKNSISRVWSRAGRVSPQLQQEQPLLQNAILNHMCETNPVVARHIAIATAEVARHSWPRRWPALFPILVAILQRHQEPADVLVRDRCLFTLHQVLKVLSQKRLLIVRKQFEAVSAELLAPVMSLWQMDISSLLNQFHSVFAKTVAATEGKTAVESQASTPAWLNLEELTATAQRAVLSMKCVHRIIVWGIPNVQAMPGTRTFFESAPEGMTFLLNVRDAILESRSEARMLLGRVSKLCRVIAQTVLETQSQQPVAFVPLLELYMRHFVQYIAVAAQRRDADGNHAFSRFLYLALSFVSNCISSRSYRVGLDGGDASGGGGAPAAGSSGAKQPSLSFSATGGVKVADERVLAAARASICNVLLSTAGGEAVVKPLVGVLVTRFLPLSRQDIERWREEPEVMLIEEQVGGNATQCPRVAADTLLRWLMQRFEAHTLPVIFDMTMRALLMQAPGGDGDVGYRALAVHAAAGGGVLYPEALTMDGLLAAVSSGAHVLAPVFAHQGLTFDVLHTRFLLVHMQRQSHVGQTTNEQQDLPCLLQRRCLQCIGEWSAFIPPNAREAVLRSAINAIGDGDGGAPSGLELATRVTAVMTLRHLMDDSEAGDVTADMLAPHLHTLFDTLFALVLACSELETKTRILNVVRLAVEILRQRVGGGLSSVVQCVPILWARSGDHNLLRCRLLELLTLLTGVLGGCSAEMHSFLVPMLQYALDTRYDDRAYLIEYGIELWRAILFNAPTGGGSNGGGSICGDANALLDLFAVWPTLLSHSLSHLEDLAAILESYVLWAGRSFMDRYAVSLSPFISSVLKESSDRGAVILAGVLETIAHLFPGETPTVFESCLKVMLSDVLDVQLAETRQSEAKDLVAVRSDVVIARNLHVLARLLFENFEGSVAALLNGAEGSSTSNSLSLAAGLIPSLMDIWLRKLNCMPEVYARRLSVLALVSCLQLGDRDPRVMVFLARICESAVQLLGQLGGAAERRAVREDVMKTLNESPQALHVERQRVALLVLEDAAEACDLAAVLREGIERCSNFSTFAQSWAAVDPAAKSILAAR